MNDFDSDVVVIGGGLMGATALMQLADAGLTAIGLEQDRSMWLIAPAVHFDGETMRTLQRLGVARETQEVTLPLRTVATLDEEASGPAHTDDNQRETQSWSDRIGVHQAEVDRLIRSAIERTPEIELRSGWCVANITDLGDSVELQVSDPDGVEQVVRTRWVIAADDTQLGNGHRLGISDITFSEHAQWLVSYGEISDTPSDAADTVQIGTDMRPALWLRLSDERIRMEFLLLPDDDPQEIVTPAAAERISRSICPAVSFTADRRSIHTNRSRVAATWRVGNIFLAGGAAHQAPLMLGQGFAGGVRDIENLAWKLDLVNRGRADQALLDTYESERKPHASHRLEVAQRQAVIVQADGPEDAFKRHVVAVRQSDAPVERAFSALGPGLHEGDRDARAGVLGIQPILTDGTRLDDMVGRHFLVATDRNTFLGLSSELREKLDEDGDIVVLLDPAKVGQILAQANSLAVVQRPDHYVFGLADSAADLERILRTLPSIACSATAAATN